MQVVTHARPGKDPRAAYDAAIARVDAEIARLHRPARTGAATATRRASPQARPRPRWRRERFEAAVERAQGVHPRRRHLPGRAGAALSAAARRVEPFDALPRAARGEPAPVHVLPASCGDARPGRRLARDAGAPRAASASSCGRSPAPGRAGATPEEDARLERGAAGRREGAGRARHAGRPRPQRRRPGRRCRHGRG